MRTPGATARMSPGMRLPPTYREYDPLPELVDRAGLDKPPPPGLPVRAWLRADTPELPDTPSGLDGIPDGR